MNRFRLHASLCRLSCIFPIGIALALLSCGEPQSRSIRYRVVIEVDTAKGVRSGSSVWQAVYPRTPWYALRPATPGARGEAVVVDLPDGQMLFALLSQRGLRDYAAHLPRDIFAKQLSLPVNGGLMSAKPDVEKQVAYLNREKPFGVLRPKQMPTLVRFRDPQDPHTLEVLAPKDVSTAFGKSVRLKRISVQVTDEPISSGLERKLPWLNRLSEFRGDKSNPFTSTLPREVGDLKRTG